MSEHTDSERLAMLVHEVRSPVAALRALAETLQRGDVDPEARRQLVTGDPARVAAERRIPVVEGDGRLRSEGRTCHAAVGGGPYAASEQLGARCRRDPVSCVAARGLHTRGTRRAPLLGRTQPMEARRRV